MSDSKIRKLWSSYLKETPIIRIPFRKDTSSDGSEVVRYAYVSILPWHEDDMNVIDAAATPFDYMATVFAFDRSLAPIQYHPIFFSESELVSGHGFITESSSHLNAFVRKLRNMINEGQLKEESSLLPAFDRLDAESLISSKDFKRKTPDIFGVESVKRFMSRLSYEQSEDFVNHRSRLYDAAGSDSLTVGKLMPYEEILGHLEFLDECELKETDRFLNAFKSWDVNWELVGKLRNVAGATPYSYGYFNADYKNEILLQNGELKVINPRHEALVSYPLFANEIAENQALRKTVDQGKALVPELLKEIDVHTGRDVVIGKRLMKTIAGKDILTPKGWGAYDYVTMLAVIPDNLEPETKEEREAMEFCVEVMLMLEKETGNSIMSMMRGAKGGWVSFKERMVAATANRRLPNGMNEEFHEWLMKRIPVDEWKSEENADLVRYAIVEFVESIEDDIPGDLITDHLVGWLTAVYSPYDSLDFMRDFIKGVDDVINLFGIKVAAPLAVHLSGEEDGVITNDVAMSSLKVSRDILFYRDRSANDLLGMILSFHAEMNEIRAHGIEGLRKQVGVVHVSEFDYREGSIRRIYRTLKRNSERIDLGLSEDMEWAPLVPVTSVAPNGYKIVPLVNMEDLKTESVHMEHCVGRSRHYELACIEGKSNIYTVLNPDNERKTTLEIYLNHKERTVRVVQNQAFRNYHDGSRDIRMARKAVNWFAMMINQGVIEGEWQIVKDFKKEAINENKEPVSDLSVNEMAEYRSSFVSALSDAILPWRKYLDKSLREMTIRDFEAFPSVQRTAKLINPYCEYDIKTIEVSDVEQEEVPKPAWQM